MRRNTNGSIFLLQESYYNKKEFVKDLMGYGTQRVFEQRGV